MSKMSEEQLNIALMMMIGVNKESIAQQGAKLYLVNNFTQVEAGKKVGCSKQAISIAANRIIKAYDRAVQIKEIFENGTAGGKPISDADKFEITKLVRRNEGETSSLKAAERVLVHGETTQQAAEAEGLEPVTVYRAVDILLENYAKALEVKKMFDAMV